MNKAAAFGISKDKDNKVLSAMIIDVSEVNEVYVLDCMKWL